MVSAFGKKKEEDLPIHTAFLLPPRDKLGDELVKHHLN